MTIHKSPAVTAGLMPDFGSPAGMVLTRNTEWYPTATVTCLDTIQMIPIPKHAKILKIGIYYNTVHGNVGMRDCDIGDGQDQDRFLTFINTAHNYKEFPKDATVAQLKAGYFKTFNTDDTIDITLNKVNSDLVAASDIYLRMSVEYMMVSAIADEDT